MAASTDRGIPMCKVSPKYLHSNSTSHKWPFSAIAELIDNAYDPDVKAKQMWIDKSVIKGQNCLIFMDNGAGMDYETMHNMLSFGFSSKKTIKGHAPVGQYGNGFKSGSMRLGSDAIVFSRRAENMCVGLLSQTYLDDIKAENVIVPIITFKPTEQNFSVAPEHEASLQDILKYTFFNKEELLTELRVINEQSSKQSGTRIIIWNLRSSYRNKSEFDFGSDNYDIRIPDDLENIMDDNNQRDRDAFVPESQYSLRAYCSILYQKPRMQIIIRGKKVQAQYVSKSLAHTAKDKYKPSFLNKGIVVTLGYNTKSKEHYGIMMYHKNRLIKAYERVACQRKVENTGVGVIGVIECNYLTPTHNKQDFQDTEEYRKTMLSLSNKIEDYWKEMCHRFKEDCAVPVEENVKEPDQNWVQCDDCLKWRKLPDGIYVKKLPEMWYCHMNSDPEYRSCEVEEDSQANDDNDQPKYQKTYKNKKRKLPQDDEGSKRTKAETDSESNTNKSSPTSTVLAGRLNLINAKDESGDALMIHEEVKMEQSEKIQKLDEFISQLKKESQRAQIKEHQDSMQALPVINCAMDCQVTKPKKRENRLKDKKCIRCKNLEKELEEMKKNQKAIQSKENKETQTENHTGMDIDTEMNTHEDDTHVKEDINKD